MSELAIVDGGQLEEVTEISEVGAQVHVFCDVLKVLSWFGALLVDRSSEARNDKDDRS